MHAPLVIPRPGGGGLVAEQTIRQQGGCSRPTASPSGGRVADSFSTTKRSHNIASISKGNEFNLGSQRPGASTDVTFTAAGEAQVFCAIHPA